MSFSDIINFDGFWELVPLVQTSLVAALLLGVIAGLMAPMVIAKDLPFAVHGMAELSFAGASAALLLGVSVNMGSIAGAIVAALLLTFMGVRAKQRNSIIGILLPFGLGLGVLFLSLYKGRSSNKFGLLTGQIVAVEPAGLVNIAVVAIIVLVVLTVFGRRMYFSAVDPVVARASGVNGGALTLVFMLLLALVCAMAVQMVGALLVMSLIITPAAAAARVTARPMAQYALSVCFAVVSAVGGILLSLSPGLPISPYVTSLSFTIYLVCWLVERIRIKRGWGRGQGDPSESHAGVSARLGATPVTGGMASA